MPIHAGELREFTYPRITDIVVSFDGPYMTILSWKVPVWTMYSLNPGTISDRKLKFELQFLCQIFYYEHFCSLKRIY